MGVAQWPQDPLPLLKFLLGCWVILCCFFQQWKYKCFILETGCFTDNSFACWSMITQEAGWGPRNETGETMKFLPWANQIVEWWGPKRGVGVLLLSSKVSKFIKEKREGNVSIIAQCTKLVLWSRNLGSLPVLHGPLSTVSNSQCRAGSSPWTLLDVVPKSKEKKERK